MNNREQGPEFAPIRTFIKDLKIIVSFFDKDDKIVREEKLNYGNEDDRKWLGRLSWWGWSNGYTIETRKDE